MKIAGLQWIQYRRLSSGVLLHFPPFNQSHKRLTSFSHSPLLSNEHSNRERARERKARQIERKKDEMREKASTVADLIYSVTQQVSLCLPNLLNHEIWIDAVN